MIKTWQQRCEEHPDHDGIVSEGMIRARMQEEIDELRAAIEQAQEPVAWADMAVRGEDKGLSWTPGHFHKTPLYTAPRQWQGLTDEDIWQTLGGNGPAKLAYARAIEQAHGIGGSND